MKQGRTLQELAAELQRRDNAKADYLAATTQIELEVEDSSVAMNIGEKGSFQIASNAHHQLGTYLDIPWKYYERMLSHPELLVENANYWLKNMGTPGPTRMLRTLDGNVRAFLSDRYRRIDNVQVASAVLPVISEMQGATVSSCEVTDDRMYLKVVNPRLTAEIVPGDVVQAGIVISNSEVGLGSVNVSPLIFRLICSNGMIAQDSSVRKYHVGRANEADIDLNLYRDETIYQDDLAFMMKLQDTVRAAVDQAIFSRIVDQMKESRDAKIEAKAAPKVVELASKQVGITQTEQEGILGYLIEGGDLSLYGLGNAVTKFAQEVDSYDRSTALENIGYKVMTLAPGTWKKIVSAASETEISKSNYF